MNFNPKAPPVYKPVSRQAASSVPQTRTHNATMQLKAAGNFRNETRPAPPAYRPFSNSQPMQPKRPGINGAHSQNQMKGVTPPRPYTPGVNTAAHHHSAQKSHGSCGCSSSVSACSCKRSHPVLQMSKKKSTKKPDPPAEEPSAAPTIDCAALLLLIQAFRAAQAGGQSPDEDDFSRHDAWTASRKHHRFRNATFGQLAGDLQRIYDQHCGGHDDAGTGAAGSTSAKTIGTGHLASWITGVPAW